MDIVDLMEGVPIDKCSICKINLTPENGTHFEKCVHVYCSKCVENMVSCPCHRNGKLIRFADNPRIREQFRTFYALLRNEVDSFDIQNDVEIIDDTNMEVDEGETNHPLQREEEKEVVQSKHPEEQIVNGNSTENDNTEDSLPEQSESSSLPDSESEPETERVKLVREQLEQLSEQLKAFWRENPDFSVFYKKLMDEGDGEIQKKVIMYFYKIPTLTHRNLLLKFLGKFSMGEESNSIFKSDLVIVSYENRMLTPDIVLLGAAAKGLLLVSTQWCEDSLSGNCLKPPNEYLLYPPWMPGLKEAQKNAEVQGPGLFAGFGFVLPPVRSPSAYIRVVTAANHIVKLRCSDLTLLLKAAGAVVVSENAKWSKLSVCASRTIPSSLMVGQWTRPILLSAARSTAEECRPDTLVLPVSWFVECILQFRILEPEKFII